MLKIIAILSISATVLAHAQSHTATEEWVTNRLRIARADMTNHVAGQIAPLWQAVSNAAPAQPTGVPVWIGTNGSDFATVEPGPVFVAWNRTQAGWHATPEAEGIDTSALPFPLALGEYGLFIVLTNPDDTFGIYYGSDWRKDSVDDFSITNFTLVNVYDQRGVEVNYRRAATNFVSTFALLSSLSNYISRTEWLAASNALAQAAASAQGAADDALWDAGQAAATANQAFQDAGSALQLIGGEGGIESRLASKAEAWGGTISNTTLMGVTTIRNIAPTNLFSRLYFSNDTLYSEHFIP